MKNYSKVAFTFGPGFGARLRELRKRQGLTLRQLALLMDRHQPSSFNLLARLERGEVKYPSFAVVIDYLRACRAGFRDLLPMLDEYTSQPPVLRAKGNKAVADLLKSLPGPEQRAMLKWEKAIVRARELPPVAAPAKRKPKVETQEQRVIRLVWSFIHANWGEVREQKLYEALLKLKGTLRQRQRGRACAIGRRFFDVLTQDYANPKRRSTALALAERRAGDSGFDADTVTTLLQAATDAHDELERTGRLEWEPTPDQIVAARGHAPAVTKAEIRLAKEEVQPSTLYAMNVGLVRSMVSNTVNRRLEELRLDFQTRNPYLRWTRNLVAIAVDHGTDSPEWRAEIDRAAPKLHDPQLAREIATLAATTFEVWKIRIPPKPAAH
jgi:transcriptional regulator with XRE-family HTH domain